MAHLAKKRQFVRASLTHEKKDKDCITFSNTKLPASRQKTQRARNLHQINRLPINVAL
jgi:hypothetical protein